MATIIKLRFKNVGSKIDAAKIVEVSWEIYKPSAKPSDEPTVKKSGRTLTDGDGVLTINDVEFDDGENLRLKYTVGTQTGSILLKHTAESKASRPLELTQWLSLTLNVTLTDAVPKTLIKDKDFTRQIQKPGRLNTVTVIKADSPARTDGDGVFTEDIEINEQEKLQVKFTIDGKIDILTVNHTEETKSGNPYKIKRPITLTEKVDPYVQPVFQPVAVADEITNPERNWLTYESLFNKEKFRKPSCEFKLSLFLIPVNDVLIWLRDDVSPEHLQTFVNSFFPDFEAAHIKDLANKRWSWKNKDSDFWILDFPDKNDDKNDDKIVSNNIIFTPTLICGNRGKMKLYLEPYAVLPYNRFDNIETSNALATKDLDKSLLRIKEKLPYLWSAWKTASRSCLVKLPKVPVKEAGKLWKTGGDDSIARDFENWTYDKTHREPLFENLRENPYDLKKLDRRHDFSLKTGVQYIGRNFQGGTKHKDVIGDWLIGCLRSDYINYVDKKLKPPKADLMILTELIAITEKEIRKHPDKDVNYREGIQVRDISILDPGKIYFAPLNIPFLDLEFKEFKTEFSYFSEKPAATAEEVEAWKEFWKYAFAALLGRAKALTLLRYGLQIVNPNQQNFLIEFEERDGKIQPTGTIVVRDLNDASIHREVVWALFDGEGLPPQETRGGWKHLSKIKIPVIEFEFTEGRMAKEGFANVSPQETGTKSEGTYEDFGEPGTQFLWQRFSAFSNLDKGAEIQEDPVLSHKSEKNIATEIYRNLLLTMADWGMAHNKSYIGCVEKHLGVNFRDVKWSRCPNPSRYKNLKTIGGAKAETTTVILKKTASNPRLEIIEISHAEISEDDKKIVAERLEITDEVKLKAEAEVMRKLSEEEKLQLTEEGKRKLIDARIRVKEEIKEMFETRPCFQIHGKSYTENTKLVIGGVKVDEDLFISTPTKIFVGDQMETSFKPLIEKREGSKMTISDADDSISYKFTKDPEYQTEIHWEEASSKIIHNFLASAEGQKAIRDCRDRQWKLIKPSFTVQLTGVDQKPFAWKRVFMKNADKEWTDLTDEKGKIDVYKESVDEVINICPQKDEGVTAAPIWLECKAAVWEGVTIKIV